MIRTFHNPIDNKNIDSVMNSVPLINFSLTTGSYNSFVEKIIQSASKKKAAIICVANVHMFAEAQQDASFLNIINSAEIVTPDGKPMAWALGLLYGIKQDRVAGMDLLPDLLVEMEKSQQSAYFYGGSQDMLDKTKAFLTSKFPNLPLAGFYSPPFRALTATEEDEIIEQINQASPNIIFVILGCPKQEKWMASVKNKINAVMIGVGGALPVMIGLQKRAPEWMQHAGLEWLYRLSQEPGRLFKRYAVTNSVFVWYIFKEFFRLKFSPAKLNSNNNS